METMTIVQYGLGTFAHKTSNLAISQYHSYHRRYDYIVIGISIVFIIIAIAVVIIIIIIVVVVVVVGGVIVIIIITINVALCYIVNSWLSLSLSYYHLSTRCTRMIIMICSDVLYHAMRFFHFRSIVNRSAHLNLEYARTKKDDTIQK